MRLKRSASEPEKKIQNRIPAVEKTIAILQLIASESAGATSKAIAAEAGASPSTCYRILKTLEDASWICQDDYGGFHIGHGLLPIVEPLSMTRQIIRTARPILERLARELKLTVKLCAAQGEDQVTIAVGSPEIPLGILSPVGIPYPIVEAVTGSALLAHLDQEELEKLIARTPPSHWQHVQPDELRERIQQCKERGWCQNIGTHPQGIDAIACPIETREMRLALGMIGLRGDFSETMLSRFKRELLGLRKTLEGVIVQSLKPGRK